MQAGKPSVGKSWAISQSCPLMRRSSRVSRRADQEKEETYSYPVACDRPTTKKHRAAGILARNRARSETSKQVKSIKGTTMAAAQSELHPIPALNPDSLQKICLEYILLWIKRLANLPAGMAALIFLLGHLFNWDILVFHFLFAFPALGEELSLRQRQQPRRFWMGMKKLTGNTFGMQ